VTFADPISGLFPTGVDNTNNLLPFGSTDIHYVLNGSNAIVAAPNPAWITSPNASWIGPTASGNDNVSDTTIYYYTTTFNLPSDTILDLVSLSVTFAADNSFTVQVYVNGQNTGQPLIQNDFTTFTTFTVDGGSSPFFAAGTNTLTFRVENSWTRGPSPSGLLISAISGSFTTNDVRLAIDIYPGIWVSGPIGSTNQIEYVSELAATNWMPLTNIVLQQSPTLIIDPEPARRSHRYYRAFRVQ
jgi:hypothetical protein